MIGYGGMETKQETGLSGGGGNIRSQESGWET